METAKTTQIEVTVTFPLGETPFHGRYEESTTVGEVRTAAMKHFGVVEDPQYTSTSRMMGSGRATRQRWARSPSTLAD